jgi:hypothetical protein
MKQSEVDACMARAMDPASADDTYYPRACFGVAIWILSQGLTLSPEQIEWAKAEGVRLRDRYEADDDADPDAVSALREELQQVLDAEQHRGAGKEKHIKGLFERVGDLVGAGESPQVNRPG